MICRNHVARWLFGVAMMTIASVSAQLGPMSVTPAAGNAQSQNFSFTFSENTGGQNLTVVDILINSALDGRNACYIAYVTSGQVLYRVADDGTTLMGWNQGNAAPYNANNNNRQCAITAWSQSVAGTTLTLNMSITFTSTFGGNRIAYLSSRNAGGAIKGWDVGGVWSVPPLPATIPVAVSVLPSAVSGQGVNGISATIVELAGAADIGVVSALINSALDGSNACYLVYDSPNHAYYLVPDSGNAAALLNATGTTAQNSQCILNGSASSAAVNGTQLVVNFNVQFKAAFSGNRVEYLSAGTRNQGSNSGWQAVGVWTGPPAGSSGTVSLVAPFTFPATAQPGSAQMFTFHYNDPAGSNDIAGGQVTFAATGAGVSCQVVWDSAGAVSVVTGSTAQYGYLGQAGAPPASSVCTVYAANSTLTRVQTGSQTGYDLSLSISFNSFAGVHAISASGENDAGQVSALQQLGSISVAGSLTITTTSLPNGWISTTYAPTTFQATGGGGYAWVIVPGSGALPNGLSLSSAGVLSGTPAASGTSRFRVRVTDATGGATTTAYSIIVWPGPAAYTLTASPLSQTVTVGSQAQVSFAINPINGFTGGVTLTAGGVGSWTYSPNPATTQSTLTVGPFNTPGTVYVTAGNNTHVVNLNVTSASNSSPSVTCSPSANPVAPGQTVTFTAYGSGGTMPYSYSWSGAASGSGPTISLQPQTSVSELVTITDHSGRSNSSSCQVAVQAPVTLSLPSTVGSGASVTLTVTLAAPAPTGGASVMLSSSNSTAFPVPASISVNAGQRTASAVVRAGVVGGSTVVNVSASYNNNIGRSTVDVMAGPTITSDPADVKLLTPGGTATFTAAATGSPAPAVQWQVSTDNGMTFISISGASSTTLSLTASAADNGKRYQAVFTNSSGTISSRIAGLWLYPSTPLSLADFIACVSGSTGPGACTLGPTSDTLSSTITVGRSNVTISGTSPREALLIRGAYGPLLRVGGVVDSGGVPIALKGFVIRNLTFCGGFISGANGYPPPRAVDAGNAGWGDPGNPCPQGSANHPGSFKLQISGTDVAASGFSGSGQPFTGTTQYNVWINNTWFEDPAAGAPVWVSTTRLQTDSLPFDSVNNPIVDTGHINDVFISQSTLSGGGVQLGTSVAGVVYSDHTQCDNNPNYLEDSTLTARV